jgi:hypothetical protein
VKAAELVMRTLTVPGLVLAPRPERQAVATTEVGHQVMQPVVEILIFMTLRTAAAAVGTVKKAEVAVAVAQVAGQAAASIPTKNHLALSVKGNLYQLRAVQQNETLSHTRRGTEMVTTEYSPGAGLWFKDAF